ncbi:lupus La protein [Tanacetum coccineum]
MVNVPILDPYSLDKLEWKTHNNKVKAFSVATVWSCIRPRGDEINWYDVVWFSHYIPRHAFHVWLVVKHKLKTQDSLRQWEVSSNTNLNMFECPLCGLHPDSHDHLFFECIFSFQVWDNVKFFVGLPNVVASLDSIANCLILMARKRSVRSAIFNLVFAASSYFIWQERNNKLFNNQKRSKDHIIEVIKSTVRLKLLTCKFMKTNNVEAFLQLWKLPNSLIRTSS